MPTVTLKRPLEWQNEVRASSARFKVLACGRRIGKSTLGDIALVDSALAGQPCGLFSPTYKLLLEQWRELKNILHEVIRYKSEQDHRIELVNGGVIECWSLDSGDPARGRRYARVVIDEAALVPDLLNTWQLAIRPTLTDLEGDGWFLSTPRGLGDFHILYQRGLNDDQHEWQSWQLPTLANPYISPAELELARAELTERAFQQEFLAQFLDTEGAGIFRGVHAVSRLAPRAPERGHMYVFGVDWAAGGEDYTVICIMDASTREQVAVDRFSTHDFDVSATRLHKLAAIYRPQVILAEQNAIGMPLVQRLQRGWTDVLGHRWPSLPVQGFVTSNASKAAAVQALALEIENGEITLLDHPLQTAELLAYETKQLPGGQLRYSAPDGGHDDLVVALFLAAQASRVETRIVRSTYSFARN